MKLQATISRLSTMLLIGLHWATSPDNCRVQTRTDTVNVHQKQRRLLKREGRVILTEFLTHCVYCLKYPTKLCM